MDEALIDRRAQLVDATLADMNSFSKGGAYGTFILEGDRHISISASAD